MLIIQEFGVGTRDLADHGQQLGVRALEIGNPAQQTGRRRRRDEQRGNRIPGLLETQRHLKGQQCPHTVSEKRHLPRRRILWFQHRAQPVGQVRDTGVLGQVLAGSLARILHGDTFCSAGESSGERHIELRRTTGVREDVEPRIEWLWAAFHQIGISPCLRETR